MSAICIKADISIGELFDKFSILGTRQERIEGPNKFADIRIDIGCLNTIWGENISASLKMDTLKSKLKGVNIAISKLEDDIRDHERNDNFGDNFIALARGVYKTNDKHAAVKREINRLIGSTVIEEKSYRDY